MNNTLTIVIIGIYTAIYLIVFFVQRSQINSHKEIIQSMKSFIDIFKIKEVKDYVKLREENIAMRHEKLINDNEAIQKMIEEANNDTFDQLREIYIKQMGEEHTELVSFIFNVLILHPKKSRNELIEKTLPNTKRYFYDMIYDYENNKL